MKVGKAYLQSISGKLTCSEVMQLLMEQPTKPVDRKMPSHAHMHTMEGFKPRAEGFGGDGFSLSRKQMHYENPTHLYPEGSEQDFGRFVYASGASGAYGSYRGVMQDVDRLPPTREYADRTGLPELPAVSGPAKYRVFRKVPQNKPVPEEKNSMAEVNLLLERDYVFKGGKIMVTVVGGAQLLPLVKASPAHTMFTDTESMVMHLTAALLSNAGKRVLHGLMTLTPPDPKKTMGIFSRSAVRAVNAADVRVENKMIERQLEVDRGQPRSPGTGFYPATGRILTAESGIDHAVVILSRSAAGDLNVVTCYPSKTTTGASIGTPTDGSEDIAEFRIGEHTKVRQDTLPALRW